MPDNSSEGLETDKTLEMTPKRVKKKVKIGLSDFTSLESFESTVSKDVEQSPELSNETMKREWMKYAESQASPQLKVMMTDALIELKTEELSIQVPSEMAKTRIQDEKELMDKIRSLLGSNQHKLSFHVLESIINEEDIEKVPITSREKLEYMIEKNKSFEDMIDLFSLRLED